MRIRMVMDGFNGMMAWVIATRWVILAETGAVKLNLKLNKDFDEGDYKLFLNSSSFQAGTAFKAVRSRMQNLKRI